MIAVGNPYLDAFHAARGDDWRNVEAYSARRSLVTEYAWAVPNDQALAAIAKHSPVVEIGAGTGYWAHLLQQMGCEIHPYDLHPPSCGANKFRHSREWCNVRAGAPTTLLESPYNSGAWSLFLCWPYMEDVAVKCLECFKGDTVIYIGESVGGCTANDEFFERIKREYEEIEGVRIPQWSGMHDRLQVYRRRVP